MDDPNAPVPPAGPPPERADAPSALPPGASSALPATAAPPSTHHHRTRRWFLVAGGAVCVGAGAGVAAELVQRRPHRAPAAPPAELVAAVAAERALLADLDATTGGSPAVRRVLRQVRADHATHLVTLAGIVAGYGAARTPSAASSSGTAPETSSAPTGRPLTRAELHAAEQHASRAAAARAERLTGAPAVLLASIAACEATHADLLS